MSMLRRLFHLRILWVSLYAIGASGVQRKFFREKMEFYQHAVWRNSADSNFWFPAVIFLKA